MQNNFTSSYGPNMRNLTYIYSNVKSFLQVSLIFMFHNFVIINLSLGKYVVISVKSSIYALKEIKALTKMIKYNPI